MHYLTQHPWYDVGGLSIIALTALAVFICRTLPANGRWYTPRSVGSERAQRIHNL
jgi:hypothetical protein